MIIILLFEKVGAIGLVLGAYLTVRGTTSAGTSHEVILSLLSGLTPLLAVSVGKSYFNIPTTLAGLSASRILVLLVGCAAANAIVLNGYLLVSGHLQGDFIQFATVFVGDIVGAGMVFLLLSNLLVFALPRQSGLNQ